MPVEIKKRNHKSDGDNYKKLTINYSVNYSTNLFKMIMKNSIRYVSILFLLVGVFSQRLNAQDIPLFSQKMSNSFLYNPSIAGQQHGSITLAHRSLFSKVNGSAKDIYLSYHKPFFDKSIGVGLTAFSERVNFVENVFVSGAFSYHLELPGENLLSLGVAGEYNSIGFDQSSVIGESDDPIISNRLSRLDFSTGVSFWTRNFELGVSANRLASLMDLVDDANLLSEYYSVFYKHKIRLGGDEGKLLEPIASYRQLSDVSNIWSAGTYFTFQNMVLGGVSYHSSKNVNVTLAGGLMKKAWVGVSYQMQVNKYKKDLGSSFEIVLRYDIDKEVSAQKKNHFGKRKKSKKRGGPSKRKNKKFKN